MRKLFSVIVFITIFSSVSFAQIGGLKDKMKKKANDKKEEVIEGSKDNKSTDRNSTSPATPTDSNNSTRQSDDEGNLLNKLRSTSDSGSGSRVGGGSKKVNVDLDFNSLPYKPSIVWSSLLDGPYYNAVNGEFKWSTLDATFLPTKKKDGSEFKYPKYENPNPPVWMDLMDKTSGALVGTLYYEGNPQSPPFMGLNLIETIDGHMSINVSKGGSYEAKFFVGGQHFYTFPFSIKEIANSDPYSPVPKLFFMEGEWPSWGYFELGDKDALIWNFYYTHQTTEVPNTARWDIVKLLQYKMQIKKGNTIVGTYNQATGTGANELSDLRPKNAKWTAFSNVIYKHPKGKDKANLYLSDLADGNYSIEMEFYDGNKKIETKSFPFSVSGGKLKPDPKADRSAQYDPITFVEQGKKKFFVSAKK